MSESFCAMSMRDIINQFNRLSGRRIRERKTFSKILGNVCTLHSHFDAIFNEYFSSFVRQSSRSTLRFDTTDEVLIADKHVAIKLLGKS